MYNLYPLALYKLFKALEIAKQFHAATGIVLPTTKQQLKNSTWKRPAESTWSMLQQVYNCHVEQLLWSYANKHKQKKI